MADLALRQWELDGLVFGEGTPIVVTDYAPSGKPEAQVQDQQRQRRDGLAFGRDFLGGQLHTFELTVNTESSATAREHLRLLAQVWNSGRKAAGQELALRMNIADFDETMVVFGRPRKFEPARLDFLDRGRVDYIADFQARDGLWYSDTLHQVTLTQVPSESSGLVEPLVEPLSTEAYGARQGFVTNAGNDESPFVVRFNGPCAQPSLMLVGPNQIMKLDMSIADNSFVDIDTHARTVIRDGTANVAGKLTRNSRFFSLPAGVSELRYQAIDVTATSNAVVQWRDASTSI